MPNSRKQNRFCFTLFNYDDWTVPLAGGDLDSIRYLCFGEEKCPTTGRRHLQGYIVFRDAILIRDVIDTCFVDRDVRVFVAKGKSSENVAYCRKDGVFTEFGDQPSDEFTAMERLRGYVREIRDESKSVASFVLDMPEVFHMYGRTLERAEDLTLSGRFRDFVPRVYWLYGPTGSGKTRRAVELAGNSVYWYQHSDHGWQDGYSGESSIIIDDFRGNIKYEELLRMLDRYPYSFPRRGRRPVPVMATTFIITSSLSPDEAYPRRNERDSIAQLRRRITEEIYLCGQSSRDSESNNQRIGLLGGDAELRDGELPEQDISSEVRNVQEEWSFQRSVPVLNRVRVGVGGPQGNREPGDPGLSAYHPGLEWREGIIREYGGPQ